MPKVAEDAAGRISKRTGAATGVCLGKYAAKANAASAEARAVAAIHGHFLEVDADGGVAVTGGSRSSMATSRADCQRSSGFLRRQRRMTRSSHAGVIGCTSLSGTGSCSRIAAMMLTGDLLSNARLPVSIS